VNAPVIAFFSHREGAGKTFLAYHLAWMYSDLGYSVLAADCDPQADLSAALLGDEKLEELQMEEPAPTICSVLRELLSGREELAVPHLERAHEGFEPVVATTSIQEMGAPAVIAGDPGLASFEEELSIAWSSDPGDGKALQAISAFRRIIQKAAEIRKAGVVLLDLGSNLGALNRSALTAADFVVFPLAADSLSLQALRHSGSALRRWSRQQRAEGGAMQPIGYVAQRPPVRLDRPARSLEHWLEEIPKTYRSAVLGEPEGAGVGLDEDPHCLGLLKPYPGLQSLAHEARKPIFHLKPADGAMGSHNEAARAVEREFTHLAQTLAKRTDLRKREN
jgi:cellulose biosynthesis protein BcsQ